MQFRRRQVLKMLALSCLRPQRGFASICADWLNTSFFDGAEVSILFHGFFFMEFQGDILVVASPPYKPHHFRYRDHGRKVFKKPKTLTDLRSQLAQGDKKQFPPQILNFSRGAILGSGTFINPNGVYPFLMKLPLPKQIVPLRLDSNINTFSLSGKVAESIKKNCGTDRVLSLVTCFKYDIRSDPGFTTRNYYAEHCAIPDDLEMKKMLLAAKNTFRSEFDLQISGLTCDLPPAPADEDENSLRELRLRWGNPCLLKKTSCVGHSSMGIVHTANCPQFGIIP